MTLFKSILSVGAALWALATGLAHAQTGPDVRWRVSTGVEYSSGDFGAAQDTEVIYAPVTVGVSVDKWRFRATLPFLSVDGPADATVVTDEDGGSGVGSVDDGDPATRPITRRDSGLGDLSLAVSRGFYDLGDTNAYIDLNARVRLPTGDEEKGLSVGETDYGVGAEFGVDGKTGGAYVSTGYRFRGDPEGRDRRDGPVAGLGGYLKVSKKAQVGAFYDWRRASRVTSDDPQEAGGYIAYSVTDQTRLELNGRAGLTDNTPDFAVGVRVSWRQKRR